MCLFVLINSFLSQQIHITLSADVAYSSQFDTQLQVREVLQKIQTQLCS